MKHLAIVATLSLILVFSLSPVVAQNIYKWTDAQGRVHFSNTPTGDATAVDEELPPATSFGGQPGATPPSLDPTVSSPPDTPSTPSTTTAPPADSERDETAPSSGGEPAATDGDPTAAAEEPASLLPEASAEMLEQPKAYDSAKDTVNDEDQPAIDEPDEESAE